jgi:VanZ family protein
VSFIKYWLPVYLFAALIFFLSSLPKLPEPPLELPFLDKIGHLLEYALFGYLLKRGFSNSPRTKLSSHSSFLVVVTAFLYGVSDEVHQIFVPTRNPEVLDLLFDGTGAFLGQFFYNPKKGRKEKGDGGIF